MSETEELLKRAEGAVAARASWDDLLRDAYRYAAPELDSQLQGYRMAGARRRSSVYDSTAIQAVNDAAAQTHMKLTPPHTRFFSIEWAAEVEVSDEDRSLVLLSDQLFKHINRSAFHSVIELAYAQAQIAQACICINEANSNSLSAFDIEVIPAGEIYPEHAWRPSERSVWRIRSVRIDVLASRWKLNRGLTEGTGRTYNDAENNEILTEGALWHAYKGKFRYVAIVGKGEKAQIVEDQWQATSPFIVGGYSEAPGENVPRGPVLSVLPDIKTANKIVELILKNASIAVTGIWQADDDGIVNPATIKLVPGAIIPKAVGSEGLQPLKSPGSFDVAEIQLQRLQMVIRDAILRRELPRMDKSHVTAAAVNQEAIEVELLRMPGLLVLWRTLIVPVIRRCADILQRRGLWPPGFHEYIETKVLVEPVAPWLRAQVLADVQQEAAALQMAAILSPERLQMVVNVPSWQRSVLSRLGFKPEMMRTEEEIEESVAQDDQARAIAAVAETAGRAAPALKTLEGAGNER